MKPISTWKQLANAISPHLNTPDPVEALKRTGVELAGEVAEGLSKATAARQPKAFDHALFQRLEATFGPPPPTRLHIGRGDHIGPLPVAADEPGDPAVRPTGYAGLASVDLTVVNKIVAELWSVRTIPHEFSVEKTASLISVEQLRTACTGVPDDAQAATAKLTAPPVVSTSAKTSVNIHVDLSFEIALAAAVPASLTGVFEVELPLDFQVLVPPNVRLSLDAVENALGALKVAAGSTIQPRSEEARVTLEDNFNARLRSALLFLFHGSNVLSFPRSIAIAKRTFPNSTIDIVQMGAAVVHRGGRDFAIVGINVESPQDIDNPALATQSLPLLPDTLHASVVQQFFTDALSAVITSGDLAAFFNRIVQRHSPVDVVDVVVNSGRVVFEQGKLRVSLDCVAVDACVFKKDLKFKATVSGIPTIENGTLAIAASEIDFDLDNSDALLCTLFSGILGPFGIIGTVIVLAFLAAINPQAKDIDIPVAGTSDPLPGSDKVVDVSLTRATMTPGVLTADGFIRLVADAIHTFVHLRITSGILAVMSHPLAGATVDLLELDSPAPEGDDVAIPDLEETDVFTPKFEITKSTSFTPGADQLLGTRKTDDDGNVHFVVVCNAVGGVAKTTRRQEDLHSGHVTTTTTSVTIPEAKPDLAVTIRTASGAVIATRLLVALNLPGKHLGTLDEPVVVHIKKDPVFENV